MKKNSRFSYLLIVVLVALVISACAPKATPTPIAGYVETSVASTMQALSTQESLRALEKRMTQMAMPTATFAPTFTPTLLPTVAQTVALPKPTSAPIATQRPIVLPPASTAIPPLPTICLKATFISETIPDGTVLAANEAFTKKWTLKNEGSCTWTTEFDFAFVSGEKMGGASIDMPKSVAPGGSITISIPMKAPATAGDYTGLWSFVDQGGVHFGLGDAGTGNVSVRIVVK